MGIPVKVTAIGNSSGVILPKEVISRLKIAKGDTVYLTETATGYEVTPYDEAFAKQVEAGEKYMKKYRDVLRQLAK